MNNPEDIFQHLPPSDRPAEQSHGVVLRSEKDVKLLGLAAQSLLLIPEKNDRPLKDFDRATNVIDRAKKLGIEVEHAEALNYLSLAEQELAAKQAEDERLGQFETQWKNGDLPPVSAQHPIPWEEAVKRARHKVEQSNSTQEAEND